MLTLSRPALRTLATVCTIFAGLFVMQALPASAEIKKVMLVCSKKLCPIFLPQLPKPAGWSVDQATSEANKVSVLVPTGSDFASAEAVIYGRAYFNSDKSTIESRAKTSNDKWLASVKNSSIERLADVARDKGGAAFQVFRYKNPGNAQQASEMVAFGEDTDKEGNLYGVQIVVTAAGEDALANNRAAFFAVLKGY
jgi:hypothetical protein